LKINSKTKPMFVMSPPPDGAAPSRYS